MASSAAASSDRGGDGTRDIKSYTACHNTLDTPELLENILLHLPMRDLLLDQRVCKTWKACIDNSVKLQRGLFFKPAGKIIAPPTFSENILHEWSRPDDLFVNPLLLDAFGSFNMARELLQLEVKLPLEDSFTREEASWRRMLFTQPPRASINLSSQVLQAENQLIEADDGSPEIVALMEALDSGNVATTPERSDAVINAIDEYKERFLSIFPQHLRQSVRQAFEEARSKDEQERRHLFNQILQGVPLFQIFDLVQQLSLFAIKWAAIQDVIAPATLSAVLFNLPAYESAEQLEGI